MTTDVTIRAAPIELDRFLKLAGAVPSGGEARHLIDEALVRVNGETELRRRRKLNPGDLVEIEGADESYRVSSAPAPPA